MIYLLSGEIKIFTLPIDDEHEQLPTTLPLIKTISPHDFTVFYDLQIDLFSTVRRYRMLARASISSEVITIANSDLMTLLNQPSFQELKDFLQTRPADLIQQSPFFRGLNPDQIAMIESSLQIVPLVDNTVIIERGKRKKTEKGGEMAILLYGQCVTRSSLGTKAPPSLHSLHPLSLLEKKAAESSSKQHSHRRPSIRHPWPQKADGATILPSHLQRTDKLISLGSVIGGELCIRDDLEALQSVFIASPSIVGIITQEDLFHINKIYPTTMDTLQSNMAYVFLESLTQSVPLLWNISPENLYQVSKNVEIVSTTSQTKLVDTKDNDENNSNNHTTPPMNEKFYMIVKGEVEVNYHPDSHYRLSPTLPANATSPTYQPLLRDGDYFGELSLVLSYPLRATISTTSPSILLTLRKDAFLRYLNSPIGREMLSEMSIRLQGRDVPLLHMLRHSSGYQSFVQFLTKELSSESALFWKHVDQLEDQCALWLMATPVRKNEKQQNQNKLSNTQQLQQILQVPENEVVSLTPMSTQGSSGMDEAGNSDQPPRKKMDPNMSSSRIKIAYSASSFSYSEDNTSFSTYTQRYAHKHQQTILLNLEILLLMCDEIIRLYLTGLSQYEVNIPMTMLHHIRSEWEYLQEKIKRCVAEEKERNILINVSEYHDVLQHVSNLFIRSKHEVYMVLRDDCYVRYKKTQEFDEFILKMRPYV